ncbi:acyl-CoA dehydrogenase [Phyllosticta citrichinensis]|uniref:Acyl-CoA dehydrogenase n=1 Tax=Phyllosticta citrichinensis TaxID=1130410 RepID=A0ABR1Y2F8_9PEZI
MAPATPSTTHTRAAVSAHNSASDLWTIIDHRVYDLSDFVDAHPGGSIVLQQVAGTDATTAFYNLHRHEVLSQFNDLCIGTVEGETPEVVDVGVGELSPVPYAEPMWLRPAFHSPYYGDSHRRLRREVREFVERWVKPEAQACEASGKHISQELIDRMAATNVLAMRLGPGRHLHGRKLLEGAVEGEKFDYFHDLIVAQEMTRNNARGFQGNMAGLVIGLTAVKEWARDKELRDRVTEECLTGKKKICLAITEAFAGSDVSGIRTTAKKTADGKHYIISGTKKWITNGMFSDYFVVGCRTEKGFSVILVEKGDDVDTKPIKTSYSSTAATTFIEFDNVKVPVNHLLGEEHKGFKVIMSNFNHERWGMAAAALRFSRTIVEECLKWSNQRIVFGKKLSEQPVIRQKLAKMISLVESGQAWLEQITQQMCQMSYEEQARHLGGPIALLKVFATRTTHEVADEAANIFGGRALTQSGMGKLVEQFSRTHKFDAILGGTEEILADLGVRQALKEMPKAML